MAGEEESGVNQAGEVPGPQSCAGNLPWRSRLLQPGHFKQRWRQTPWGCRPDSEPPSFRRCSDLRRWQVSKKCPVGPSPSGRWCSGFALYPRGDRRSACVRVRVHVCARVCLCVYTQSPGPDCQGYSDCIQGLKLPEKGKGESERARRGREGGREGSGWAAEAGTGRLESFSPLCHTRHPQPQRGLLSRLQEVHCKSSAQPARQSPFFPRLLSLTAPPVRDPWSLWLLTPSAKEDPAGEMWLYQISHQDRQRIWRIVCKLKHSPKPDYIYYTVWWVPVCSRKIRVSNEVLESPRSKG